MQGFPQAASPLSADGAPIPGVAHVGGPAYPGGVTPNLTQYPTAPMTGFPPQGFPAQQMAPMPYQPTTGVAPSATYPGAGAAIPGGQAPLYSQVPGPATLGPAPMAGAPGGVPGVSMAPVSSMQPPASPGGPHPLPPMPQVPLPQGFPNPFAMQQLQAQPQPMGQGPVPQGGGQTTITGPQGYLPGIGHFGNGGIPGPATAPTAGPVQAPAQAPYYAGMPQARAPVGFPPMPMPQQLQPQAPAPQATPVPAQAPGAGQQQQSPFFLHLAWQLAHTPAVKSAIGEKHQSLLADDRRGQTLQVAVQCLQSPEIQNAFRALSNGSLDQTRFTESFAGALRGALQAARMLD